MITDPIEKIIAGALSERRVTFEVPTEGLDFYLPAFDTFIECKQFHSARIARQMSLASNVIAIQGRGAAVAFATLLEGENRED